MQIQTKHFGTINIDENKIITFEDGLLGFTEYKKYTILFDETDKEPIISWLQSIEDKNIALPIINPLIIKPDYAPVVEDELLKSLGDNIDKSLLIFCVTVIPEKIENITTNLKAPIIVHTETKKGRQVMVENEEYIIRYPIYEHIKKLKGKNDIEEKVCE